MLFAILLEEFLNLQGHDENRNRIFKFPSRRNIQTSISTFLFKDHRIKRDAIVSNPVNGSIIAISVILDFLEIPLVSKSQIKI